MTNAGVARARDLCQTHSLLTGGGMNLYHILSCCVTYTEFIMSKSGTGNASLFKFVQGHPWLVVVLVGVAVAALLLFGITASPAAAQSEPQTVGKVTGLTATTAGQPDGTVCLTWDAAENAQVYMVLFLKHDDVIAGNYANGQMRAFTATQGAISGLDGGAKYYFIARGMRFNWTDFSEALGDWSTVASATPPGIPGEPSSTSPQAEPQTVGGVTGLQASSEGQPPGTVRLTWNAAENSQVYMVLFLKHDDVIVGNYADGQMRVFTATQGTVSGLDGGAKYYFIARGMRFNWTDFSEALGDWSTVQSATPAQIPGREYLYEAIQPPMAPAYIDWRWDTGQGGFRKLSTDFTIHNDVGDWSDQHGLYLILLQNDISGAGFYFGLQTDANGRGKGVIFSRWKTDDLANARWDETDGWYELGRHEGGFLGVRRSYDWSAGDYRIRIAPDGLESDGEWFGLWITDLATGETTWVGSLKFPLLDGTATFNPRASATIELYGNPQIRPVDVPQWHVSVKRPLGDGVPATWGSTSYPWDASENALFNSDVRYDESEDAAHLRVGGLTERKDSAVSRIDFKPLAFFTDLEHADWLEQNKPALANQIKALPWVATGVADSEREAAEQLIRAARWYPDTFNILMEMSWVQGSVVTADEAKAILQIRWSAHYSAELSRQMSQKPWVQDGITTTEADAMQDLAWTIREAPALAGRMLSLPWIQDDGISDHGATAIDWIYRLNRYYAPVLAEQMLQKSWIQDNITETEADALKYLRWIIGRNADAGTALIAMPFLNSVEIRDTLALRSLNNISARDASDFSELMSHPRIKDGITDEETKIVAVLGGRTYSSAPGSAQVLLAETGVYIEERLIELPHTGETLLAVIRTEDRVTPRMDHLEHAVRSMERFMGVPFPIDYLALLYYDHPQVNNANNNFTHLLIPAEADSVDGPDWHASVIAHEAAHWYWRNDGDGYQYQNWITEGSAEFLRIISEHERIGRPLEPIKSPCPFFDNISELEKANPDRTFTPGQTTPRICYYSLGQRFFLDLYLALGDETFRPAYRALY